jgi:hypothetical protein
MKRDPFLHWLLTMVSFGQYGLVWAFLMARDVNQLGETKRLNLRLHAGVFCSAYAFLMFGCVYLGVGGWAAMTEEEFQRIETTNSWMMPLAIGLTVYMVWLLVFVAKRLRGLTKSHKPKTAKVIFLYALLALSLPLLQKHLNAVIQNRMKPGP